MWGALQPRLSHWHAIIRGFTWKALIAVPFAVLGAFALVRDEFLPAELQAKLKVPSLLPDWRWQSWALCALAALLIAVLESSYREHAKLAGGPRRVEIEAERDELVRRELSKCTPSQIGLLRTIRVLGSAPDDTAMTELDAVKFFLKRDFSRGYGGFKDELANSIKRNLDRPDDARKSEAASPNTALNALRILIGSGEDFERTEAVAAGVNRVVRIAVLNDGSGFLSNCRAHIVNLVPGGLSSPRVLADGTFSLQRGEKRWLDVSYQHQSRPGQFLISGPVGAGYGGGYLGVPAGSYFLTVKVVAEEARTKEATAEIFADGDGRLRIKPA